MQPFYVYMLKCIDGSYYTGHTDSIEVRLAQHNQGLCSGYTSKRRPLELVFVQTFGERIEALEAEFQIKKWSRKKKEALIAQDWELLSELAKSRSCSEKN